jgi:hypothetical protein
MSYLKDREIWLSSVPTGNPPAGYVWVFIQNGVFVVRDSNGIDKIMATTTGTVTNATSASYVEYSNVADKPALISGSSQVSFNGITDKPALVSSSAQIVGYNVFATTGSNQFNGSQAVTGSLTVTGQVVAQTLNVQQVTSSIVYSSGSNIFGNSLGNTQQFTGSVSVTGSLTVNGVNYLPLTGGTLTGALSGTSANFSSTITSTITNALVLSNNTSTTQYVYTSLANSVGNARYGVDYRSGGGLGTGTSANSAVFGNAGNADVDITTNNISRLKISSTGAATFSGSVTALAGILSNTYNGGGTGMLHLTSNGTEGGTITFEKTSGTTQKYKIGNSGAAFFVYDETGAKQPFTILNNGNIGIGTTDPVAALNVSNVPSSFFGIIETTGTSAGTVKHFRVHKPGYVEYGIGILADNSFHISTASTFPTTNGFTMTSGGSVGIGTTTPTDTLQVVGSSKWGTSTNNIVSFADGTGVYMELLGTSTATRQLRIQGINNAANSYSSIRLEAGISEIAFTTIDLERMRITSTGAVTKPYQPAFRAGRSASYAPGANSNIIFNSVFFNIGSHYNAANGLFTAPIAGRYYFSASVIWESVPDGQEMDDAFTIRVNGNVAAYDFRRAEYVAGTTGNGGYYVTNANTLLNLAANDTVSIRNNRNLTVHGNEQFSWFVGYLLG